MYSTPPRQQLTAKDRRKLHEVLQDKELLEKIRRDTEGILFHDQEVRLVILRRQNFLADSKQAPRVRAFRRRVRAFRRRVRARFEETKEAIFEVHDTGDIWSAGYVTLRSIDKGSNA